nr:hypothetical protein CR513_13819 [Ipomoea batatas]
MKISVFIKPILKPPGPTLRDLAAKSSQIKLLENPFTFEKSNWNAFLDRSMISAVFFFPNKMDASPSSLFRDKSILTKSSLAKDAGNLPVLHLTEERRNGAGDVSPANFQDREVGELGDGRRNVPGEFCNLVEYQRLEIRKVPDGRRNLAGEIRGDDI